MGVLQIKQVTRSVEDVEFDCGVSSINEFVRNSYFPTISQHAYAYSIAKDSMILGYYQILFREIEIDNFPEEISEYDSGVKDGKISAIHIRFIAVDIEYQNNGVGSAILKVIIRKVLDLSKEWPIKVITIDALPHLESWYEKEGFIKMKKVDVGIEGYEVPMCFIINNYPEELDEYLELCS